MARIKDISPDLKNWQRQIEQKARSYGLDYVEVVFEVVDYEEINELASMGGFPQRYPHWRFGMDYDKLSKSYRHGLSKIYEMVINTDPCYAYLLSSNSVMEQKLVMAHVYGHADFFKNNVYFAHTNRRMLDQMANHAVQMREYQERHGVEQVEEFIDRCLSIDNLIDHHVGAIQRQAKKADAAAKSAPGGADEPAARDPNKSYMDKFVREANASHASPVVNQPEERKKIPESPERDVLGFLLDHAPLNTWQRGVLTIVRDEAYYFLPQMQTKIMNEGWASYWHAKLMTGHFLADSEVVDFADVHSGTMATAPGGFNPYKVGIELFWDIEERWNKGQFGKEWEECDDYLAKGNWDKKLNLGTQKVFEVRRIYNDLTFIDEFFTEDFCRKNKFFTFAKSERSGDYEIESRDFQKVKSQFLKQLTNFGQPIIEVVDSNFKNRGELLLHHVHDGTDLRPDYSEATLRNLAGIWGRPANLETIVEEKPVLLSHDGTQFSSSPL